MRVLVVDDNPIMRMGLRTMLCDLPQVSYVAEAANGEQALTVLAKDGRFDVVFLDVRMPGMGGIAALREITDTPVVMLTSTEDPVTVRQALGLGARGYLVHGEFGVSELVAALATCSQGGMVLSPPAAAAMLRDDPAPVGDVAGNARRLGLSGREGEYLAALADGLSNAEIGRRLFVSEKTVKNCLYRVYAKLGVSSRSEAVVVWRGER